MECSHALLDLVMQQYEKNEVKHVPITQCTSRDQELAGYKKDSTISLDSEGQLKLKQPSVQARVDTSTDFRLYQAFNRRGLAYDQANLLPYVQHLKWVDYLFAAMQRKPPEGYAQVSMNQALAADQQLWKKLADSTRDGIVPLATGDYPLQKAMEKWCEHAEVLFFLLPLPKSSYGAQSSDRQYDSSNRFNPKGSKGKSKGAAKGKGKGKSKNSSTPKMPEGCVTKTQRGHPLCFAYNSPDGCTGAQPGGKCSRGLHLCARPNCWAKHSAVGCPNAAN